MSKLPAPTIWPATIRLRARLEQPLTFASVKQPATPHGPFGADRRAHVFRFSRSVCAISWSLIDMSSLVDLADAVDQRHLRRGHVAGPPL